MTNSFQLTEDAEQDIIEIYLYALSEFGEAQADRYVTKLYERFEALAAQPLSGADFGAIHPGARRANHESHAVYYRQNGPDILILRILHQRMDPARHLV